APSLPIACGEMSNFLDWWARASSTRSAGGRRPATLPRRCRVAREPVHVSSRKLTGCSCSFCNGSRSVPRRFRGGPVAAHDLEKLPQVERFRQDLVRVDLPAALLDVLGGGDDDDGQVVAIARAELARALPAVHDR